ncbi:MAG TPA: glycosyltransferase family 39 protein [Thermoanaerobaculia bacterium]|nr:glycosyltransferase family 39 protein [Thermoanaerobaculia bacterium]
MTATASPAPAPASRWWTSAAALAGTMAAVKLLLPLFNAAPFGYFRDELYYLVCGLRPDWGYVDHPSMAPLLAVAGWKLFGETLYGLRFFPAAFGAAAMLLAALMARRLRGGVFAQALAALLVLAAPFYLVIGSKLSTDSFEVFFWTALAWITLRILQENQPRLWLWFGLIAGVGLHAKHSVAFFAFALVAGIAFSSRRRLLWSRWLVAGGAVALLLFLPNLLWQWQHGWPTFELLDNIRRSHKNVVLNPLEYFGQQIFLLGPLAFPLWLAGLVWLLRGRDDKGHRALGFAYLITFAVLVLLKGKSYYLGPAYPMLFAAGAVAFERWTARRWSWLRAGYVALVIAGTLVLLPIGLPLMSPERTAGWQRTLGISPPRTEHSHTAELPQHLADRLGWEEMVASAARAYHALPEGERAQAGIFAQNFGEAGAIDILGRKHGLPPALSGHQNYYLWGPRGYSGEVLVVVDTPTHTLNELCRAVEYAGPVGSHPHAMPFEQRMGIYVCRGLSPPLPELWPRVKNWF